MIVVAGDLNGHVGATKDGYSCYGGFGYGSRNADGFVTDAKTVPYETVATQHRPLICSLKITPPRYKEAAVISRIWLPTVTTVDETWTDATKAITRAARLELGTTKPGRRWVDKQAWRWTGDVREKVRERNGSITYLSVIKQSIIGGIIEKRRKLQRRQWPLLKPHATLICPQAEDIEKFFGINDENGHLLMDRKRAAKRWHDYFEEISNVEFEHPAARFASAVHGPCRRSQ
ncbi:unnamed protein product [Heligmosomoides polygyrus]|uniref:Endo/exonuclease/phosphatase domain-containing protein n=1 Tax=Heligmosomoides polygyrus TaxID=6339 RepID=A0A183GDE5_HELPZ|nr:unnamed protein product [Heligmosomoides polygyrus]